MVKYVPFKINLKARQPFKKYELQGLKPMLYNTESLKQE